MKVLTVGGNGRVGKQVLTSLLLRSDVTEIRAIVRSKNSLPPAVVAHPKFTAVEASLLDMSVDELAKEMEGTHAVICTLGHNMNWGSVPLLGIWAAPRDLVTQASKLICEAIEKSVPVRPVRFVLLNTIGCTNPDGSDAKTYTRTSGEKALIATLKALTPPYADSCTSVDYVSKTVGTTNPFIEWVAVRPDGFIEGPRSEYTVTPAMDHAIFNAVKTTMANIGHFMSELATDAETWDMWKFKMPVIVDTHQPTK
ncbi:hypothetical protein PhCBS80983_g06096 [Powellomyces hirtus]|uniref:NAD(P)-binding domain-containing protein n=1 Tax=Powellomyces hirtus TaxID=109895 RepID=A0A507DRS5_9FUNG|nr:hypothetical protein PhCBS80983_g06096 [Powellomyces hirtus]